MAVFSLDAAARTAPMCWAQMNVVVRQPELSDSTTPQTVWKSASGPPAEAGPVSPYSPASASASSNSTGTTSAASVARAAGNSTSSARRWAVPRMSMRRFLFHGDWRRQVGGGREPLPFTSNPVDLEAGGLVHLTGACRTIRPSVDLYPYPQRVPTM